MRDLPSANPAELIPRLLPRSRPSDLCLFLCLSWRHFSPLGRRLSKQASRLNPSACKKEEKVSKQRQSEMWLATSLRNKLSALSSWRCPVVGRESDGCGSAPIRRRATGMPATRSGSPGAGRRQLGSRELEFLFGKRLRPTDKFGRSEHSVGWFSLFLKIQLATVPGEAPQRR